MALEALLAAIWIDPEEVVEQELDRTMSSCPADQQTPQFGQPADLARENIAYNYQSGPVGSIHPIGARMKQLHQPASALS